MNQKRNEERAAVEKYTCYKFDDDLMPLKENIGDDSKTHVHWQGMMMRIMTMIMMLTMMMHTTIMAMMMTTTPILQAWTPQHRGPQTETTQDIAALLQ